ncbi:MAG: pitrilysin family protein [Prevotella sp.]|nr:pitrilysin family protein [Prevotella sp.]
MKYSTYTFPNGLRLIYLPSDSPVVYCGFEIAAGSRQEGPDEEGLAHFVEHTTFKGTERRSAWQILNYLEAVGGDLNAFTTKEDTVYYAAVLKEHVPRAIDLLTDIVFHSVYPQKEIDKEVEVICDEIESYNDTPSDLIYDDFENIIFKGTPLGHNILGTADRVRSFTTADALRFTKKYYRPDNAIFFIYGGGELSFDPHKKPWSILANIPKAIESPSISWKDCDEASEAFEKPLPFRGGVGERLILRHLSTHQAHVMIGCRAYDVHDERRMALYLLNNILGGPGMNAKLNVALREHHGLVYTVESTMVSYGDTGIWCIYFGCDPEDIDRCIKLIRRELQPFMDKPLSDRQLQAAKKQLKGQIGVACDNRENFALDFGKSFLHWGWEKDITALYAHIDAITASQIQQVAQELFPAENLTTLIYS